MKLADAATQMRALGVRRASLSAEGDVLECELFEGAPAAGPPEPPESPEAAALREKQEAAEAEKLLFMASEGNPDLPLAFPLPFAVPASK
jgi:hypothetical protein